MSPFGNVLLLGKPVLEIITQMNLRKFAILDRMPHVKILIYSCFDEGS